MMHRIVAFTDGAGFELAEDSGSPRRTVVTKLDGWFDGADVETERTRRLGEGLIPAATYRTARKITLGVVQDFVDEETAIRAARALSGVFPGGEIGAGSLTVADELGPLTAVDLSLDGQPKMIRSRRTLRWELPLISPDPYLYGPLQRVQIPSPGVGVGLRYPQHENGYLDYGEAYAGPAPEVTNAGNQVAYPVIEVSGSMPSGFRLDLVGDISRPGAGVTFRGDVDAGHPVTVDFWTGRVSRGDVDQSYLLTRRDWGGISPGGIASVTLASLGQGEGWADLSVRSTFA